MRNIITALLAALGMTLLVGGVLAFIGGIYQVELRVLRGLGPFDGVWDPANIRFAGAIMASLGSGVFTFAILVRRGGRWHDSDEE